MIETYLYATTEDSTHLRAVLDHPPKSARRSGKLARRRNAPTREEAEAVARMAEEWDREMGA